MGEINEYKNLTLEEKHEYWSTYLQGLINFVFTNKKVKGLEGIRDEIRRVHEIIRLFQGEEIPKTGIESKMNNKVVKSIPKKDIKAVVSAPKEIKLPKAYVPRKETVYRYRFDAASQSFKAIHDEDRSEEA
jgi:hypothetical protein